MASKNEIIKLSFELKEAAPDAARKIATSLETLFNAIQKISELKVPGNVTDSIRSIGEAAKTSVSEITKLNTKQITSTQKKQQSESVAKAINLITASAQRAVAAITALNALPITTMVGPIAPAATTAPAKAAAIVDVANIDTLQEVTEAATEAAVATTKFADASATAATASSSSASKFGALRNTYAEAEKDFAKLHTTQKEGLVDGKAYDNQVKTRQSRITELSRVTHAAAVELQGLNLAQKEGVGDAGLLKEQIDSRQTVIDLANDLIDVETEQLKTASEQKFAYDEQSTAVKKYTGDLAKLRAETEGFEADVAKFERPSDKSSAIRLAETSEALKKLETRGTQVASSMKALDSAMDLGDTKATQGVVELYREYDELGRQIEVTADAAKESIAQIGDTREATKETKTYSKAMESLREKTLPAIDAAKRFDEATKPNELDRATKQITKHEDALGRLKEKYGDFATQDPVFQKTVKDLEAARTKLAEVSKLIAKPVKPTDLQGYTKEATQAADAVKRLGTQAELLGEKFAGGLGGEVKQGIYGNELRRMEQSLGQLNKTANSELTRIGKLHRDLEREAKSSTLGVRKSLQQSMDKYNELAATTKRSLGTVRNQIKDFGLHGEALARLGIPAATLRGITEEGAVMSKGVARAFQYIGKAAGRSTGQMRTVSLALNDLEKQFVRFRSGVVTWSTGLLMLGAVVSAPFLIAIKNVAKLSDSLGIVKGITNATQIEFENLKETAEVMGRTTRFTALEAAKGLEFLGRAGFDAATAAAALPVALNLAQAAAIDLGKAADIVTNMMTAFGLSMAEIPHAADVMTAAVTNSNATLQELGTGFTYIGSLASSMGADLEDLVAALAKLHNAGFKGTMAGTALRGTLAALVNPTKDEAELLAELSERIGGLGLVIKDAEGNFVGFTEIIRQLEVASFTADEALRLFGKRAGPGVAALLKIGSKELERFTGNLKASDGITSDISETMANTLFGAFKKLFSAIEGLGQSIGGNLAPGIQWLAEAFATLINKMVEFRTALGPLAVFFDTIAATIAGLTGVLGAATFAWFLMIVPAVQFISFAHLFIVSMEKVAVSVQKGTIAQMEFATATKIAETATLRQVKSIYGLNSAMGLSMKNVPRTAGISASTAAASIKAKELLEDMKGVKTKLKEIFLAILILGKSFFIAFGQTIKASFQLAAGEMTKFVTVSGVLGSALRVLGAAFYGLYLAAYFHPLTAALIAIAAGMLLVSQNSKVLKIELQSQIDKIKFASKESQKYLKNINDIYETMDTESDLSVSIGVEKIKEEIANLVPHLQKLQGVSVKTIFGEKGEVENFRITIKETGEEFLVLSTSMRKAIKSGQKFNDYLSVKFTNRFKDLIDSIPKIEAQEIEVLSAKKLSSTIGDLDSVAKKIVQINNLLKKGYRSMGVGQVDYVLSESEIVDLEGEMLRLRSRYNLLLRESVELQGLLGLSVDQQNTALEDMARAQVKAQSFWDSKWFQGDETEIKIKTVGFKQALLDLQVLENKAKAEKTKANLNNLGGTFRALDKSISEALEHSKEVMEDLQETIDEIFDLQGEKVDFSVSGIEDSLDAELTALERAHEDKLALYNADAKNHHNIGLREAQAVEVFEQKKLEIIKASYAKRSEYLESHKKIQERYLIKGDADKRLEIDKTYLEGKKALLQEEVEASNEALDQMYAQRQALEAKLISIESSRIATRERIEGKIRGLQQRTWSDRRKLADAQRRLDTTMAEAGLALLNKQTDKARRLIKKAESEGGIVAGLIGDTDRGALFSLERDLRSLANLSDSVAVDEKKDAQAQINALNEGIKKMEASVKNLVTELEKLTIALNKAFEDALIAKGLGTGETTPERFLTRIKEDAKLAGDQVTALADTFQNLIGGARFEKDLIDTSSIPEIMNLFRLMQTEDLDFELLDPKQFALMDKAFQDLFRLKPYMESIGQGSLYDDLNLPEILQAFSTLRREGITDAERNAALKFLVDQMALLKVNANLLAPALKNVYTEIEKENKVADESIAKLNQVSAATKALEESKKSLKTVVELSAAMATLTQAASALSSAEEILTQFGGSIEKLEDKKLTAAAEKMDALKNSVLKAQELVQKARALGIDPKVLGFSADDLIKLDQAVQTLDLNYAAALKSAQENLDTAPTGVIDFKNRVASDLHDVGTTLEETIRPMVDKANKEVSRLFDVEATKLDPKLKEIGDQLTALRLATTEGLGDLSINVDLVITELNRVLLMWKAIKAAKDAAQGVQTGGAIITSKEGGIIPSFFAEGGSAFRRPRYSVVPGGGTGDRVPAMLEAGEFILRKTAVQALGIPFLNMLNQGALKLFAAGGAVASMPGSITSALSHIQMPSPVLHFQQGGAVTAVSAGSNQTVDIWLRLGDDKQRYLVQSPKDQAAQLVKSLKHLGRGLKGGR